MRSLRIIAIVILALGGCSPVLNRDLMDQGARDFQLGHLVETPEVFKDHLFILGGVIVDTKLTEKGSQIEALFVPVNAHGDLKDTGYQGRFLAVYPRSKGLLDPIIYKRGREITLAGDFIGVRKGKIDELEYVYPVFEIRQIYLWEEHGLYPYAWPYPYYYPYYPYYYHQPYLYDPWGRYYPGPYWPPPPW
jgi:outer membrane lipoprotein